VSCLVCCVALTTCPATGRAQGAGWVVDGLIPSTVNAAPCSSKTRIQMGGGADDCLFVTCMLWATVPMTCGVPASHPGSVCFKLPLLCSMSTSQSMWLACAPAGPFCRRAFVCSIRCQNHWFCCLVARCVGIKCLFGPCVYISCGCKCHESCETLLLYEHWRATMYLELIRCLPCSSGPQSIKFTLPAVSAAHQKHMQHLSSQQTHAAHPLSA
jgi:hypothetical protein